ncbi:hypothetical protein DACRYDRAFT_20686 [Dacryopinax primogenitus]|uniref:Uncharacterized protein n=1 Tax=Dacryopinax primogenitus (strain DJM 731) TaxID=1858805 RepID=M5G6Z0_DACPD|nr:uncharacterized protein DACRYDRAFT_20686 [Dacryopinax primogenitus]EJU03980.1 hypothetical protein DACRYDRAFT_20686 [Dacryopinax primogenitus]
MSYIDMLPDLGDDYNHSRRPSSPVISMPVPNSVSSGLIIITVGVGTDTNPVTLSCNHTNTDKVSVTNTNMSSNLMKRKESPVITTNTRVSKRRVTEPDELDEDGIPFVAQFPAKSKQRRSSVSRSTTGQTRTKSSISVRHSQSSVRSGDTVRTAPTYIVSSRPIPLSEIQILSETYIFAEMIETATGKGKDNDKESELTVPAPDA